jgi:hypothetical protein
MDPIRRPRRGQEQRLEFIEFRLFWDGGVNRSDLIERFGVSVPQASNDLTAYRQTAPDNVAYDLSLKRYVPTATFTPVFLKPNPDRYLAQLKAISDGILEVSDTWLSDSPNAGVLPIPSRRTKPSVLRAVLAAVRNKRSIRISYQSSSRQNPDPQWRWISPHAFGFDGFRWHVRAYCHQENRFKDFLLGRCLDAAETRSPLIPTDGDWQWQTFFDVLLQPNPELTPGQRRAIAIDYNMTNGILIVPVRFALLYYFNKRLRFDVAEQHDQPRERPVTIANKSAFEEALRKADPSATESSKSASALPVASHSSGAHSTEHSDGK